MVVIDVLDEVGQASDSVEVRRLTGVPADLEIGLHLLREAELSEEDLALSGDDAAVDADVFPEHFHRGHGALLESLGVVPAETGVVIHLNDVQTIIGVALGCGLLGVLVEVLHDLLGGLESLQSLLHI